MWRDYDSYTLSALRLKNLFVELFHPGPVQLGPEMVFSVVAIVEPEQVVEPMVGADGIGVLISRLGSVMLQVPLGITENPADVIGG